MNSIDERREFQRHPLPAFAEIGNSTREWIAHVLDISSSGARLAILEECTLNKGDELRIRIELPPTKVGDGLHQYLHMKGTVAHQHEHIIGIRYEAETDIDLAMLELLIATY